MHAVVALVLAAAVAPQEDPTEAQRAAFAAARERLPEQLRARVADVVLVRRADLGVPPAAPLSARLFGRGALAFLDTGAREVVLTDAGASGVATWVGPRPTRADVADFLRELWPPGALGAVDEERGDEARWARFDALVRGWGGDATVPAPFAAPETLDLFLREAPWRSLGERLPLEALLLHELAHAAQLELETMLPRVAAWSAVSGWREAHDESVADGLRAAWLNERPAALIRMLLGAPRGDAEYVSGEDGAPSLYARFDPREDFAEAVRLMAYDPARLARTSPARFLAVNALGWVADRDVEAPGPLWRGPTALGEAPFRATVAAGARELWRRWRAAPDADPAAFAAVLTAHAPWLTREDLPDAEAVDAAAPADLPPELVRAVRLRATFRVADGTRLGPPPDVREALLEAALERFADTVAFDEGLALLRRSGTRDDVAQVERELLGLAAGRGRGEEVLEFLEVYGDALPAERRAAVVAREAALLRDAGLALVSARLELLHGDAPEAARIAACRALLDGVEVGRATFDHVELAFALSRLRTEHGDAAAALAAARAIPGTTWGAARRVDALLALDELALAADAARGAALPALRDRLLIVVARRHHAAGDLDAVRALSGEVRDVQRHARSLRALAR